MAHAHEEQQFDNVSAAEMWARIGDFHGMGSWHPAVERSESLNDGQARDLHLVENGGVVSETLLEEGERSYSYRIDESPLPVADYVARLWVQERGGGSTVLWEADFTPSGASEEEAVQVIRGIFRTGLGAL